MAPAPTGSCHLYRFYVRHPTTGQRVLGYVGETARHPFTRLMEHVNGQPWADTIVSWEMDETPYPDKPAVLAAERAAILRELPLYNIEHNRDNPHRIPPWTAQEQAAMRRGMTPPPAPRRRATVRRPAVGRPPVRPVWMPSRRMVRRVARNRFAQAASGWVAMTVVFAAWFTTLQGGAVLSAVLLGAAAWQVKPRRRRRRR